MCLWFSYEQCFSEMNGIVVAPSTTVSQYF